MYAAGSGDGASVETLKLLLELGASPLRTPGAESPVALACHGLGWGYTPGGDAARVRLLLDVESSLPTEPNLLNRILCRTAGDGDAARLQILLSLGLDPHGHFDAAKARPGASTERATSTDPPGKDPFTYVIGGPSPEAVRASAEDEQRRFERRYSAPWAHDIPLFCAAESGDALRVSLLLKAGADPLARDNSGRTALYYANSRPVVRVLREAGVPVEDVDEIQYSPLRNAISQGSHARPRIQALIEEGADINARDSRDFTLFMFAASQGRDAALLRRLAQLGLDPLATTNRGWNAFHAAAAVSIETESEEQVRESLRCLQELGLDINPSTDVRPLELAIREGDARLVRVMCELGADPDPSRARRAPGTLPQAPGERALIFLATSPSTYEGLLKLEALLAANADPLVLDTEGRTPFEYSLSLICEALPDRSANIRSLVSLLHASIKDESTSPADREAFLAYVRRCYQLALDEFVTRTTAVNATQYVRDRLAKITPCAALLGAHESWNRRVHT